MSGPADLLRWARLWRSLPEDERRARAGRVTDRLLRRSRVVRALGLSPSTPSWRSFEQALTVPIDELTARLSQRTLSWLPRGAGAGAGETPPAAIDWHLDPVSGVRWDPSAYFTDVQTVRLDGSDVKVPWERARFQHLLPLGKTHASEAAAEILSFLAGNPPGLGVNWASPMEVALRAVSFSAALEYFRGLPGWEPSFLRELARSLWVHGRHIRRNLELPDAAPATNHYLANLLGLLVIARTLPELREAAAWGDLARNGLIEEIGRQVGDDGVSFERSLPYHGFVTEMLIHAARIERAAGRPMPPAFLGRLAAMLEAIAWCVRPDGTMPAIGDGDDGRVLRLSGEEGLLSLGGEITGRPDIAAIATYAPWSSTCGRRFAASGFCVLRARDVHVAVAAGPVGTRGLGNHTHNDLFAPTYFALGREWITDPGTGSYARDPDLRNALRGVAAHAALQLGTREPNELPPGRDGLFRVIEKAHPEITAWEATRERATLTARHTGYSGPEGAWTWERRLTLDAASGIVSAEDRLEAAAGIDVATAPKDVWLRFPLAAGLAAKIEGSRVVVADPAGRKIAIELSVPPGADVRIEPSRVSPRYGVVEPSTAVVVRIPTARVVAATWSLTPVAGPG